MTLQKLASAIAKREGKKSQARIGDIREILKIICTLDAEAGLATENQMSGPIVALIKSSEKIEERLAKRKVKKK